MGTFGLQTGVATGSEIEVIADGLYYGFKTGGVTMDWSTVSAVGSDTTLPNGRIVKTGDKYLRHGQVICMIGTGEVQTIDLSAGPDPTAGTFIINWNGQSTTALAFNASAADVQAAMEALNNVSEGDLVVTKSGYIYTFTWLPRLGNVAAPTVTSSLTGSATQSVTIATGTAGVGTNLYGPYDSTASDGRQTLTRGRCFVLNKSVVYSDPRSDHPAAFDAGLVYKARLRTNENDPGLNLATFANFLTAFPAIRFHE